MLHQCAFLTMENPDGFFVYDHLAYEPLRHLGWEVTDIPWTRPDVAWNVFDAVIIRSPWDYQNAPDQFLRTLEAIEQSGARLLNPLSVCRWNLDKTYLRDLQKRGVPIVPTKWLDRLDKGAMADLLAGCGRTERVVLKPTVGAGAEGIYVVSPDTSNITESALSYYACRPLMVQPFLKSIQNVGEYSLFYFGGQYSHAILKQPKPGDFRVQEEHGGIIQVILPPDELFQTAEAALAAIDETLLYARVDIVLLEDQSPAVIELELVEPSLYFPYDSHSPSRFAEALHRIWGREISIRSPSQESWPG